MLEVLWRICAFIGSVLQFDYDHNPNTTTRRRLSGFSLIIALIIIGMLLYVVFGMLHHHPISPFPYNPGK